MNKYPGIYKALDGTIYYYLNKSNFFSPERGRWEEDCDNNDHKTDVNITAEYLANTYGKVESKEHAEFIRKLCEVNGVSVNEHPSNLDTHFVIINNILHYCYSKPSVEAKQITIPLPPECESVDEWPKVGDEVVTNSGKGVVKLPPDNSGFYVVSVAGEYLTLKITAIQKPKTPEQELRDELHAHFEKYTFVDQAINELTIKYNITKKPQ